MLKWQGCLGISTCHKFARPTATWDLTPVLTRSRQRLFDGASGLPPGSCAVKTSRRRFGLGLWPAPIFVQIHLYQRSPTMKAVSKAGPPVVSGPGTLGTLRREFGFKTGVSGAHTARTTMLADLTPLLAAAPKHAKREDFNRLVVEENVLGKRTTSNRWLTARHLADLYALDQGVTVFRLLRVFWEGDVPARPMLALLCAQARDALFRLSAKKVLETKPGETMTSEDFVKFFDQGCPGRFSEAMTLSLAQNIAASWAQAGFFKGKVTKVRTRPLTTSAAAAYALALGYLCGLRGQILIESDWARLLDVPRDQLIRLAQEASRRGWLDFKGAGNIFEVNFPRLLTPTETKASHGPD